MDYKSYLRTDHWIKTRSEKVKSNSCCNVCGKTEKLNAHHKRYKGKDGKSVLFNEPQTVLVVLCSSCHRLVHHYFGIDVKKLNKKICRVRRLLELGVKKNKAFLIVGTQGMWDAIYPEILKKHKVMEDLPRDIAEDIREALDTLRDATINRDITRADRLKAVLLEFLEPVGYTLREHPKKIYVLEKIERDKQLS